MNRLQINEFSIALVYSSNSFNFDWKFDENIMNNQNR